MNLLELFNSLEVPIGNVDIFNTASATGDGVFRVAVDYYGRPALLLEVRNASELKSFKNFRLKYLEVVKNIKCKISHEGVVTENTFTVIRFLSSDETLVEHFWKVSETLLQTIVHQYTPEKFIAALNNYVEVFRALSDAPSNTIHGIWSELLLIEWILSLK